jgi:beta-glucosidase
MNIHSSHFGNKFAWGVSSSAYQAEGAINADDKGLSIWDAFCKQPGKIYNNQNGNSACNFYDKYIQDLILMNYLGIRNFRFSISWSRIFPNGTGDKNENGIDFYNRLIDFCLEMNIEPWITLYHWDLPLALEHKGGWTNREILNWFTDYVETCILHFGDRVKNWMVLNEPLVFTGAGYFLGIHAPGRKGLNNFLAAAHHAVLCQSLGGRIIKSLKNDSNVGTTFSTTLIEPYEQTKLHLEAAERVDALTNRLFIEPLLGLSYPYKDLKLLHQIEKFIEPGDEAIMPFNMDFIGIQNYTREIVRYSPVFPHIHARVIKARDRNVASTTMNWEIYPESLYYILKKFAAYNEVTNIIVTENGAAFNDILIDNQVHDPQLIRFIQGYIEQLLRAKKEGVPVNGYFHWTFTDNFEWAEGYRQRFGLIYTDFATQRRIIKSSGYWFQQFLSKESFTISSSSGNTMVK